MRVLRGKWGFQNGVWILAALSARMGLRGVRLQASGALVVDIMIVLLFATLEKDLDRRPWLNVCYVISYFCLSSYFSAVLFVRRPVLDTPSQSEDHRCPKDVSRHI